MYVGQHILILSHEAFTSFSGIARPQSHFPHSCVCERFIYSQDRSTYCISCSRKDRPILEIYKSVSEITVSFLRIHKWEPHADIYNGFSAALHLQCPILPLMNRLHLFNDDIYATLFLELALYILCVTTLAFLLGWPDPQVVLPLYPAVEDVVADEHVTADHVRHLVPVLRVHAHTCTVR
jgi:hypothetical protein